MQDSAYATSAALPAQDRARPGWLAHHYGAHVHLLYDGVALLELMQLAQADTPAAAVTPLVRNLYHTLLRRFLAAAWPLVQVRSKTRMHATTPRGVWHGWVPDSAPQVVVVDIARAGTVPAQLCYEQLTALLGGDHIRQDHVYMGRRTNAQGQVDGVTMHGHKLGGPAAGSCVLVPDPMGATGTSMAEAVRLYKMQAEGPPARVVALHLIVTPEYLAHMKKQHPDVEVWAVRLDRGMSAEDVLATPPGSRWAEERGLDAHQYIVPGAGGLGELLNHAEQ